MTRLVHTAPHPGPVLLDLYVPSGTVKVTCDPDCERAKVVVRAAGYATETVRTGWADKYSRFSVHIPESDGVTPASIQNINVVGGSVAIGNSVGGDLTINGTRVSADVGADDLEITATVPEGSAIVAVTRAARVQAFGEYTAVQFTSTAGGLLVESTRLLMANTVSGRVRAEAISRCALVETVSGAIDLYVSEGAQVTARSVSGRIRVDASPTALAEGLEVDATSVSGRVITPDTDGISTAWTRRAHRGGAR